jgi:hypothetical protein
MARWSRPTGAPVAPAPGMILPGVPLVPAQRSADLAARNGDPLADPERELAAREAKAAQPLPVRIVASHAPVAESASLERPAPSAVSEPTPSGLIPSDLTPSDPTPTPPPTRDAGPAVPPAAASPPAPASTTAAPPALASTPREVTHRRPRVATSRLAAGPWPDPDSAAWPTTIPPWGRPPKGFACPSPRVAMVLKDGSQVAPEPDDARAMLGLAASLGA